MGYGKASGEAVSCFISIDLVVLGLVRADIPRALEVWFGRQGGLG
jgi:hypothetical protein